MNKFLLALSIFIINADCSANNYVYVPQDIQKLIGQEETVLSLDYGPLTNLQTLDAVVISMKAEDARRMNYDFTQLHKYPRIIYILQNQSSWKIIGKNSQLLKASDEDTEMMPTVDTHFFRTDTDAKENEFPILDIGREGKNHQLNNSMGDYKIRFSNKTRKAYIIAENYTYFTSDGENSCNVTRQYPLGQKEFSVFKDNENLLIKKLLLKQKCGE